MCAQCLTFSAAIEMVVQCKPIKDFLDTVQWADKYYRAQHCSETSWCQCRQRRNKTGDSNKRKQWVMDTFKNLKPAYLNVHYIKSITVITVTQTNKKGEWSIMPWYSILDTQHSIDTYNQTHNQEKIHEN